MSSKSWTEKAGRLRSMSSAELKARGLQEFNKRLDVLRYYLERPGFLPFRAPAEPQTGSFFFYPDQVPEIIQLLHEALPEQVDRIIAGAEKICAHKFDLLGYENLDYGPQIDWHLDRVHGKRAPRRPWHKIRYLDFNEVGDVKVTWELNRHQHLATLAKAYRISGDERFARELFAQWNDWIEQNPHPIGVNWASSLEVAFRSISWLWVKHLLAGAPGAPPRFAADLHRALAVSGRHIERYLSTFFSPNTHLLGEGVALFFIGTLCPDLPPAGRWKQLGWSTVLAEADRQVRPDGLHFEQSSYYHVYALDFFLHAALLAARNSIEVPETFERTIEQMLDILWTLSRTGTTHQFGDDDGGRVFDPRRNRAEHLADPLATGAILFDRSDFKAAAGSLREETLWLTGAEGAARFKHLAPAQVKPSSVGFEDSGLYVMADNDSQLLIDAGPHGAHTGGHGHADALSVQLAHAGKMLLIDPGTYEYVGDGQERAMFRGTAAHNALQVDHLDQSESKGPFSWSNLAETTVHSWISGDSFDLFAGSHDGYSRLRSPVIHRRWVFHRKPDFWFIRDLAEGDGRHVLEVRWHLAPDMVQSESGAPLFGLGSQDLRGRLALVTPKDSKWKVQVQRGQWSACYGRTEAANILCFGCETALPAELATIIAMAPSDAKLRTLVPLHERTSAGPVVGYSYETEQETHKFFFSTAGKEWSLADWSSDAEFVSCRVGRHGLESLIFCNGSRVNFKGAQVASTRRKITGCELSESGARKVVSPESEPVNVHQWPRISRQEKGLQMEPAPAGIGG